MSENTALTSALSELRNRKSSASERFQNLKETSEKQSSFTKEKDERFYYPEADKAGNAFAIIRFLDSPQGEDFPFVKKFSHGFKGPGGQWYIENSLTTLGQQDPVSELNSVLWKTGTEANKQIARDRKRRLEHFSNILVVSDPKHPENEGKVFLFRYGTKIFDKIKDKMNPAEEFADEKPMNPFDFWEGADFKLKIRKVDGRTNYDKSEFATPAPLYGGDDDKIAALWKQCYSLTELIDPKHFKPYEVLKAQLEKVVNGRASGTQSAAEANTADTVIDYEKSTESIASAPKPTKAATAGVADTGDDDLSFFTNLAGSDDEGAPF